MVLFVIYIQCYDFIQLFSGIIPWNGSCHHWALFVIEICLEKRLRGKDILEEERKFILNGYRFADDWIRFVHNEDASLFLRSYSDASSLSSKCMPIRMTLYPSFIPQFQEYSRQGTFFKYWRSHQDYCGLQLHHRGSSEAGCYHHTKKKWFGLVRAVMTMIIFCTCRYNCSQCTIHGCKLLQTTFQMCLIHWTHRHSIAVVVFDSNDLNWLSLEVPLWFIGRVPYYYYYYYSRWHVSKWVLCTEKTIVIRSMYRGIFQYRDVPVF